MNFVLSIVDKVYRNEHKTPMVHVISAFTFGILLSPWSKGIFFLALFMVLYEISFYLLSRGDPRYYNDLTRVGTMCASFLGFIVGRTIIGMPVTKKGVPWDCSCPDHDHSRDHEKFYNGIIC